MHSRVSATAVRGGGHFSMSLSDFMRDLAIFSAGHYYYCRKRFCHGGGVGVAVGKNSIPGSVKLGNGRNICQHLTVKSTLSA